MAKSTRAKTHRRLTIMVKDNKISTMKKAKRNKLERKLDEYNPQWN